MFKKNVIANILTLGSTNQITEVGTAFAPANIALCKYWGKRDEELNLPYQSSISLSLADLGTHTSVSPLHNGTNDIIILNNHKVASDDIFALRIIDFLNLIRSNNMHFHIETTSNIPIAAGVGSSASGFAALVESLNNLFCWQLDRKTLSILARLGSGSACRSLWHGFVEWQAGILPDGMDSYAQPFPEYWPELQLGLLLISNEKKNLSSRMGMKRSTTSPFYSSWLVKSRQDFEAIKDVIINRNFSAFGEIVESNALAMHAVMQTAWPPINYALPKTLETIQEVWSIRKTGTEIYFTQDAGPNLILLFLKNETKKVQDIFPDIQIVDPFSKCK